MGGVRLTDSDRERICRAVLLDDWSKEKARTLHPDPRGEGTRYAWVTVDAAIKWFESLRPEKATQVLQDEELRDYYKQKHGVDLTTVLPPTEEHVLAVRRYLRKLRRQVWSQLASAVEEQAAWQKGIERLYQLRREGGRGMAFPGFFVPQWRTLGDDITTAIEEHFPELPGAYDIWALATGALLRLAKTALGNELSEEQLASIGQARGEFEQGRTHLLEILDECLAEPGLMGQCPFCRG